MTNIDYLREERDELAGRVVRAEEKLRLVDELHSLADGWEAHEFCAQCEVPWPCPTIRIIQDLP